MEKKLSVGLVTQSKEEESNIRKELGSFDLGTLSVSGSHLEFLQKSLSHKHDFVMIIDSQNNSPDHLLAMPVLLRSKKHLATTPLCLMIPGSKGQLATGFFDKSVRVFPMSLGYFLPLSVMVSLAQKNESSVAQVISEKWMLEQIEQNFSKSLGEIRSSESSPEERNQEYLFEQEVECRSHLLWIKVNIRLIRVSEGLRKLAEAADMAIDDYVEEKIRPIAYEIEKQVEQDLIAEGAIFLPYLEDLNAESRKVVLGQRTSISRTLTHQDLTFFVELTRYL